MQKAILPHWEHDFGFDLSKVSWIEPGVIVSGLKEDFRTLSYSTTMSRVIDMAFGKVKKSYTPAALNKLSSKIKVGDKILSSVEADSGTIGADIRAKIIRSLEGTMKQYQNKLVKELTAQILNHEITRSSLPVDKKIVQSA